MSERVFLHRGGAELGGWALNLSRGGVRAIIEDPVELGGQYEVQIGSEGARRLCQVVWIQEEPDGAIVGISFLDGVPGDPPSRDDLPVGPLDELDELEDAPPPGGSEGSPGSESGSS